jgi:hypothetical protein
MTTMTASANTVSADRVLTLGEAVKVTGFSAGKFRYNKETLVAAGAMVTPTGWSIPLSALSSLGWLGVKPPKGVVTETPLSRALARVAELEAENASLRAAASRPRLFGRKK